MAGAGDVRVFAVEGEGGSTTGATHLRHHISPDGFYRGRKVVATKEEADKIKAQLEKSGAKVELK